MTVSALKESHTYTSTQIEKYLLSNVVKEILLDPRFQQVIETHIQQALHTLKFEAEDFGDVKCIITDSHTFAHTHDLIKQLEGHDLY